MQFDISHDFSFVIVVLETALLQMQQHFNYSSLCMGRELFLEYCYYHALVFFFRKIKGCQITIYTKGLSFSVKLGSVKSLKYNRI